MILPLFPLSTVLFPGGRLALRVFETRYIDMTRACLRESRPFGICLIAEGSEVGAPARPFSTGTLAHIVECDSAQLGILNVLVEGGTRFHLRKHWAEADGLLRGEAVAASETASAPLPDDLAPLAQVLAAVLDDMGEAPNRPPPPWRLDDTSWVGLRLAEILPIPNQAKQALLEMDDALGRAQVIYRFLKSKSLLPVA